MSKIIRSQYAGSIISDLQKDWLVLLTGARQVGKTTLMHQVADKLKIKKLYVSIEDRFGEKWKSKKEFTQWLIFEHGFDIKQPWLLMLDEIQYFYQPEALLKSLYDDPERKCMILATGSRFWGQSRVGSSLVGRWSIIQVQGFSFLEYLQSQWKFITSLEDISYELIKDYLEEYLIFWNYPAVAMAKDKLSKIQANEDIVWRLLERDFMTYISQDELVNFRSLLQYLTRCIWSIWKTQQIAQYINISSYKVEKYLQFLVDSYLIYPLYPFFTDKTKEYNAHKEYFFMNTGLINYCSKLRSIGDQEWKINENFVFTQLVHNHKIQSISYYQTKNQSEIDFIAQDTNGKLIPIEVKSNDKWLIPKIFDSFFSAYENKVNYGIVTTKSVSEKKISQWKAIEFMPYWKIEV